VVQEPSILLDGASREAHPFPSGIGETPLADASDAVAWKASTLHGYCARTGPVHGSSSHVPSREQEFPLPRRAGGEACPIKWTI
jgi:hypothetical protein